MIYCLLPFLAWICIGCSSGGEVAGSGSSLGNGVVAGIVVTVEGDPLSGVRVTLRRNEYLTSISEQYAGNETVTDASGIFRIDSLDPGDYSVEANDNLNSAVLLSAAVGSPEDSVFLGSAVLQPYAVVRGKGTGTTTGYVQIYGMERVTPLETDGSFAFTDLPSGTFTFRLVDTTADSVYRFSKITAESGDTININSYGNWLYSRRILFNTTSSGADIGYPQSQFPILVRLDSACFDFSQAEENGADIRFSDPNSAALPYEIERWNSIESCAEIWVRVPQIDAPADTDFIRMHWGNPVAQSESNGSEVFSWRYGYGAVFHFNGSYDDASSRMNHAQVGGGLPVDTQGVVGGGIGLFGSDSGFLTIPSAAGLTSAQSITVSGWFYPIEYDDFSGFVTRRSDFSIRTWGDQFNCVAIVDTGAGMTASITAGHHPDSNLVPETWSFFAATYDGITLKGYPNADFGWAWTGEAAGSLNTPDGDWDINRYLYGEGHPSAFYDEIRIETRVRDELWLRLCFVNLQHPEKFMRFE